MIMADNSIVVVIRNTGRVGTEKCTVCVDMYPSFRWNAEMSYIPEQWEELICVCIKTKKW